jgi:hypothetical protein
MLAGINRYEDSIMFIPNKYTKIYFNIISRSLSRELVKKFEKHHIIPKSMGGSNKKENLAPLTIKEHRLCHILLTKMVTTPEHKISMNCAAYRMVCCNKYSGLSKGAYYQYVREKFLEFNKSKVLSEKTKEKIREKRAYQKNISNQYLSGNRIGSPRKGKNKDNDSGYKTTSEKLKGRVITWTDKLSETANSRPKLSCTKCRKVLVVNSTTNHYKKCFQAA